MAYLRNLVYWDMPIRGLTTADIPLIHSVSVLPSMQDHILLLPEHLNDKSSIDFAKFVFRHKSSRCKSDLHVHYETSWKLLQQECSASAYTPAYMHTHYTRTGYMHITCSARRTGSHAMNTLTKTCTQAYDKHAF